MKAALRVEPCSYAEAKTAVLAWHYSERFPRGRTDKFGVWEDGRFVGCVVFGDSANKNLLTPYGLAADEGCELLRVALRAHQTPVTRVVAIATKLLRRSRPALRLIVSFADPEHGHHGGIYQAGNWVYAGMTSAGDEYLVNGRRFHGKALRQTRSTSPLRDVPARNIMEWAQKALKADVRKVRGSSKHRYLMPLDEETRRRVLPLAQPYPRATSIGSDAPAIQAGQGGASPTVALSPRTRKVA